MEPHGLKPMAAPHASKGGTLRSTPPTTLLTSFEGSPPLTFIHGLKARGFLRRRVNYASDKTFFHQLQYGYDMMSNEKLFPDLHHGGGWGDALQ